MLENSLIHKKHKTMHTLNFQIDKRKIFLSLLSFELLLALIYLIDHFFLPFKIDAFDLDLEGTFASWFSSVQLIIVSLICLSIHQRKRAFADSDYSKPLFLIASLIFMFISIDESIQIHEKLDWKLLRYADLMPSFKNNHGAWMLPYATIFFSVLFYLRHSIFDLWKTHKTGFLTALTGIALFLTGAVLLEIISFEYLRDDAHLNAYAIEVACEEFLEMFGITIVLYGLVLISQDTNPNLRST